MDITDNVMRIIAVCEVGRHEERVWHSLILQVTPKHAAQRMKKLHDMEISLH
jgi:hypothetical protein